VGEDNSFSFGNIAFEVNWRSVEREGQRPEKLLRLIVEFKPNPLVQQNAEQAQDIFMLNIDLAKEMEKHGIEDNLLAGVSGQVMLSSWLRSKQRMDTATALQVTLQT